MNISTVREVAELIFHFKNWPYLLSCSLKHEPVARIRTRRGLEFTGPKGHEEYLLTFYRENFLDDLYCPAELAIKIPRDVIVDIGANIGIVTVYFAKKFPGSRVISYEPLKGAYDALVENVYQNRLSNVTCYNEAVGCVCGSVTFFEGDKYGYSTKHPFKGDPSRYSKSIRVPQVALEDVFGRNDVEQCALLKLDCEGSEYEIIFGAPEHLLRRTRAVFMEYHDFCTEFKHTDMIDYMRGIGFQLVKLTPPNPQNGCGMLYFMRNNDSAKEQFAIGPCG